MVSQHQIRSVIHQAAGGPNPPRLRSVNALCTAMVEDHLEIGLLFRRLEALDDGPGLPLVPQAMAYDGDAVSVLLQIKGPVVAAVLQPGGRNGLHSVPIACCAIVSRVVVGQRYRFHSGAGEDARVGGGGPEPVGGIRGLLLGGQIPVRQHVLQIHHGEIVGFEDVPYMLEKVLRLLLGGVVQEVSRRPLAVERGQQHVAGEADDDAEGVLRLPGPGGGRHGPVKLRQVRLPQQGIVGVRGVPLRGGGGNGACQQLQSR